jgi:crotonobetainyl-CoA:carnitine CoA-transferase CaiB-like acyl-CoA transferase
MTGMHADASGPPMPLEGIRVAEAATMYAGPFAGRILCDLGAEVIKIEDPQGGDPARRLPPLKDGVSLGFARMNVNKKSVALDLRAAADRDRLLALLGSCDVFIEGFRPGRLSSWGLSDDRLQEANEQLVIVHISGFGQGTARQGPGFGTMADAISGFAYVNGWPSDPPTVSPFGLADCIAGISAALSATVGLVRSARHGRGSRADIALYEPLLGVMGDLVARYTALGTVESRSGNQANKNTSPRGVYQTSDGHWVVIAGSSQSVVERLFRVMGRREMNDDPRFASNAARVRNDEIVDAIVAEWISRQAKDKLLASLEEAGVAAAPVNSAADIVADEYLRARSLRPLTDPVLGQILIPGPVFHLDDWTPASYDHLPALDEDGNQIWAEVAGRALAEPGETVDQR